MGMAFSRALRGLWAPSLVFAIFGCASLFGPALLNHLGAIEGAQLHALLLNAIHTALWLAGAYLLVRLTNLLFWEGIVARGIGRPVPRLLKDSLGLFVFLLAVAGIVGIEFRQSIVGIWATSGAIGIVLGIALRNIILDIFTGLAVNFDHSYRIGDWVDLFERGFPTIRGKVIEINWRTTRIETEERRVMVVPNSKMGEMLRVDGKSDDFRQCGHRRVVRLTGQHRTLADEIARLDAVDLDLCFAVEPRYLAQPFGQDERRAGFGSLGHQVVAGGKVSQFDLATEMR